MTAPAAEFTPWHPDPLSRVELAMQDLREGRMVIMVDDEDRENEGDIVVAAECCTPEHVNFMATHARGLVCLSMTSEQMIRSKLSLLKGRLVMSAADNAQVPPPCSPSWS